MSQLVFGEVDPQDYMERTCTCGHGEREHYDGHGSSPSDEEGAFYPCWEGWDDRTEGCTCLTFKARDIAGKRDEEAPTLVG